MNFLKLSANKKNSAFLIFAVLTLSIIIVGFSLKNVRAENGWITEKSDGYYNIGNDMEVKIDILSGDQKSINDSNNLFYNGQKVYIKIDWRAVEDITQDTSTKLELPIKTNEKSVSFETPLLKNVEILSEDNAVLTTMKEEGNLITTTFFAKEESPILKGTTGQILIPHNIFTTSDGSSFIPQTLQLTLISNDNGRKVVSKQIGKIADGLNASNFILKDKAGTEELNQFENLEKNLVSLNFEYKSGPNGINGGDAVLLKFENYMEDNKVGKLVPYAHDSIALKDASGQVVGSLSFMKKSADIGSNYMRLTFNKSFEGRGQVNGNVKVLQELNFSKAISEESVITIISNKTMNLLPVRGPKEIEKSLENRFDFYLKDAQIVRKNVAINERDILNEGNVTISVTPNVILQEANNYDNYHIDEESIRIVKILGKKENASSNIASYIFENSTLKPAIVDGTDRIGETRTAYGGKRGLTISEFSSYADAKDIIKFSKDVNGYITGFDISLGKLNNQEDASGEYTTIDVDNATSSVKKSGKAFGYLVYYNLISLEEEAVSTKKEIGGTLKVQIVDKSSLPVGNVELVIENGTDFTQKGITNKDGFVEFSSLGIGKYTLKDLSDGENKLEPVEFEVTKENQTNLDLTIDRNNVNRNDISYSTRIYNNGVGQTTESYLNIISTDYEKARFKIVYKDKDTGKAVTGGEFLIFDKEGYRIDGDLGVVSIQSNGEGVSNHLPLGEYYFIQSKAPAGYANHTDKIIVKLDVNDAVNQYEVFVSGAVSIEVSNLSKGSTKGIAGTTFNIYSHNNIKEVIDTITTDENGIATSKKLPFGRYFLKQTGISGSYELISVNVPISVEFLGVNADGVFKVKIENPPVAKEVPQLELSLGNDVIDLGANEETPLSAPSFGNSEEQITATDENIQPLNNENTNQRGDENKNNPVTGETKKENPVTGDNLMLFSIVLSAAGVLFLVIVREKIIEFIAR